MHSVQHPTYIYIYIYTVFSTKVLNEYFSVNNSLFYSMPCNLLTLVYDQTVLVMTLYNIYSVFNICTKD